MNEHPSVHPTSLDAPSTDMPNVTRFTVLALTALLATSACTHAAPSMQGDVASSVGDARVDADLARLRSATNAFHSLDSAVSAGYPRESAACIVHAHHGAMGYHHVNRALLTATPDVTRPQILLYERRPDGSYAFNGVEFIVPYRLHSRDSVPPVLFGRQLKREDNLNYWYIHVWAWTNNTDGIFSDFNPAVTCPAGKATLYEPFVRGS